MILFRLARALFLGLAGGWSFGFLLLSFGVIIGRSGNVGTGGSSGLLSEILAAAGLAVFYGAPLGLLLFPIGSFLFLRKVPFQHGILYASAGTLFGGLLGALAGPPLAALAGIVGFFCGCIAANDPIEAPAG